MVEAYPEEEDEGGFEDGWGDEDDDGEGWGDDDGNNQPSDIFTVADADMMQYRDKGYRSVRSRAIAT